MRAPTSSVSTSWTVAYVREVVSVPDAFTALQVRFSYQLADVAEGSRPDGARRTVCGSPRFRSVHGRLTPVDGDLHLDEAQAEVSRIAPAPAGASTLTPTEARVADKLNVRSRSELVVRLTSQQ
jgi:hypothetical protein